MIDNSGPVMNGQISVDGTTFKVDDMSNVQQVGEDPIEDESNLQLSFSKNQDHLEVIMRNQI